LLGNKQQHLWDNSQLILSTITMSSSSLQCHFLEVQTGFVLEDPLLKSGDCEKDDDEQEHDNDGPTFLSWGFGCMLLILIFPLLLVLQCNMACQMTDT